MNRFFLITIGTYEAVRASLDEFYGHPNASAETCLPPSSDWPQPQEGTIAIAVAAPILERPEVAQNLNALLTAGQVNEISAAEFQAF